MAVILIVESDSRVTGDLARAMREAGHAPIIASDARSALQEAMNRPDIILLDLRLPDIPGEELLRRLKSLPETAEIPVLVISGKSEAAAQFGEYGDEWTAGIPIRPVYGARLSTALDAALRSQEERDADALRLTQERQRQLIQRIIVEGPNPLVFQTCRRVSLDRLGGRGSLTREVLTWTQIAEWAERERLVDPEEAHLLRRLPLARPPRSREQRA